MVLPPYTGADPTQSATMSPYKVEFLEFAQQFATSQHRADLLNGLIAYREALRNIGLTQGFQWIDGSFVEDVEQSRGRPPADIDVVTFAYGPNSRIRPHIARGSYKTKRYLVLSKLNDFIIATRSLST